MSDQNRFFFVGGSTKAEVQTSDRFEVEMGPFSVALELDRVIVPNVFADESVGDLRVEVRPFRQESTGKFSAEHARGETVTSFEGFRGTKIEVGDSVFLTGVNLGLARIIRAGCQGKALPEGSEASLLSMSERKLLLRRLVDREEMHCRACGGRCDGPCEEGDEQFEYESASTSTSDCDRCGHSKERHAWNDPTTIATWCMELGCECGDFVSKES